jgi:hypothetical protein
LFPTEPGHGQRTARRLLEELWTHGRPYTLHPTSYALHPTPYTLRPTPYTSILRRAFLFRMKSISVNKCPIIHFYPRGVKLDGQIYQFRKCEASLPYPTFQHLFTLCLSPSAVLSIFGSLVGGVTILVQS